MSDIKVYGEHEPKTLAQMQRCMTVGSAVKGVLCADGHLGYAHPIGGVVAYEEDISISGVGFDIACGNLAVRLDALYSDIAPRAKSILDDIGCAISFGVGQRNAVKVDHELFYSPLWDAAGVANLKEMARNQLGTVGSGNHYVDLFEDEEGFVWIGVHFGSRGLGHKITTKHLEWAGAKDGMEVDPAVVRADGDIGQSYVAGVELGGLYAYAGREWVVERVRQIIGAAVTDSVHNHHNFAWRETHGDRELWVVRKGATPAFPGQRGFVGGSMGDDAVILEGVESEASADSLYSTVHGAGRICGRMDAKGKKNKAGEWTRQPRFPRKQMDAWLQEKHVLLRGRDVDESPMVYRRLRMCCASTKAPSRFSTRCGRSPWRWPDQASSTPTRTEGGVRTTPSHRPCSLGAQHCPRSSADESGRLLNGGSGVRFTPRVPRNSTSTDGWPSGKATRC